MLVKKPIRRRPKNNLDRHQQKKFLTDVDQKIALIDVGQKTLDFIMFVVLRVYIYIF